MNLVCDLGNTRFKCAVFENGELKDHTSFKKAELQSFKDWCGGYAIKQAIVSSVVNHDPELEMWLQENYQTTILSNSTPVPIEIDYLTPETLGKDRLANAVAIGSKFKGSPCLAVDIGTCVKFDFVTDAGQYKGGSIAPGLKMRMKAMHTFTDQLPLIGVNPNAALVGDSSEHAMQSGATNGMINEIKGMIAEYEAKYTDLQVAITGGGSDVLKDHLDLGKNNIFALAFLTLEGLNVILEHNAE